MCFNLILPIFWRPFSFHNCMTKYLKSCVLPGPTSQRNDLTGSWCWRAGWRSACCWSCWSCSAPIMLRWWGHRSAPWIKAGLRASKTFGDKIFERELIFLLFEIRLKSQISVKKCLIDIFNFLNFLN